MPVIPNVEFVMAGMICPADEGTHFTQVIAMGSMEDCEQAYKAMSEEDRLKYSEIAVYDRDQFAESAIRKVEKQ